MEHVLPYTMAQHAAGRRLVQRLSHAGTQALAQQQHSTSRLHSLLAVGITSSKELKAAGNTKLAQIGNQNQQHLRHGLQILQTQQQQHLGRTHEGVWLQQAKPA